MRKKKVVLVEYKNEDSESVVPVAKFESIEDAEAFLKTPDIAEGQYRIITVNRTATIGSETVRKVQID